MNLTTIITTYNNEKSIKKTLENVKNLGKILIADLESSDGTVKICQEFDTEVVNVRFKNDYSLVKNELIDKVKTEWVFWIEAGEVIKSGEEFFAAQKMDKMYRIMILNGDLLTKEVRLFKKNSCKFKNPVFETLDPDLSEQTLPIVLSGEPDRSLNHLKTSLLWWKDREPLAIEPEYYMSCFNLMIRNYDQFKSSAESLFFRSKELNSSTVLTRYYLASLIRKKDPGKAIKLLLECILRYPLMAEFWCLLGDIYLFILKEYDRAYVFYENAMILGGQRLAEDTMPMEISKYEEYPKKIMESIAGAIKTSLLTHGKDSLNG